MIMPFLLRLADALNRDDDAARKLNVALSAAAGLITHGIAMWIGRGMTVDSAPWFALPNWANAIVWLLLFLLLGASRWMLNSYTIIGVSRARTMLTLLIFCCLFWPFYSLPAVDLRVSLFGNTALLLIAMASILIVRRRSIEASSLIMPLVVWLAFSVLVVLTSIGWLG